jgi:hypothetical protein
MKDKSSMDQADFMFVAQIREKLDMTEAQIERLMAATSKNLLSKAVERVFASGTRIDPAAVLAVREQSAGLGIDLRKDLGVTDDRLSRLFKVEVAAGIEDGSISTESGSEKIAEIVEGLGMPLALGETMLEELVKVRANAIMRDVAADITRGNDERAIADLDLYLNYVAFVGGEQLVTVSGNEKQQICEVYKNAKFGQEGSAERQELLVASLAM